jgi:tRNA pseudouridine38-40 synthase
MTNYKIVLSYDGTDYHGWQRQPDKPTIQGTVEDALERIGRKKAALTGAGRTDAGVHALGQAASFRIDKEMPEAELFKALNALLPDDIRVVSLERVPAEFHARRDAKGKIYQYRIWTSPGISPFAVRYVLHWLYPLHVKRMRDAAALFAREGDFTGFSSAAGPPGLARGSASAVLACDYDSRASGEPQARPLTNRVLTPVRSVVRSELRRKGDELIYTIEARGFLRYMVRTIVGTLLEVGRGRVPPAAVDEIFRAKRRTLASPTAPAKGLCLVKVIY